MVERARERLRERERERVIDMSANYMLITYMSLSEAQYVVVLTPVGFHRLPTHFEGLDDQVLVQLVLSSQNPAHKQTARWCFQVSSTCVLLVCVPGHPLIIRSM